MNKLKQWIKIFPYEKYDLNKLIVIKLSSNGLIEDWDGNADLFFNDLPVRNEPVHHIYPQFEGIFPFVHDQLSFPNIETKSGVYANIDMFYLQGSVWIVFEDNSDHVFSFQENVQKANEALLTSSSKYRIIPEKDVSFKEIYSELIYSINVGVFQYDCKGYVTYSGKQPEWIYRLKPELKNAVQVLLTDSFPFLEHFINEFEIFYKKNTAGKIESDLWSEVDTDGKEKLLQCIGISIDNTAWLLLISHDTVLTRDRDILQKAREQKLFTEELAKAKDQLQKVIDFKDQFVSIVSHDLRSPVSSVVAATDMMLADNDLKKSINDLHFEFLETINKEMKLLLEYNEKLYYWSNLQLGRFNVEVQKFDLLDALMSTKNRFSGKAVEKRIELQVDGLEGIQVEADESLFSQVLTNLTNNAMKFTPPNGKISLTSERKDNRIVVGIKDTGVGIKPEIVSKLFRGYVKNHTDGTNGEKGSGLGLGICKRILDAHGFDIEVESEVNIGTQFLIYIPEKQ